MTIVTNWEYIGGLNCEHGGAWFDLSTWDDGYVSAVRVTDLDGSCGFTGACMIEHVVVNGTDNAERIRAALRSCGCSARGLTKAATRRMLADALMHYGFASSDHNYQPYHTEIVQTHADGPMTFKERKADKRLHNTRLRQYIESTHLR
jgi:hypothetical protein